VSSRLRKTVVISDLQAPDHDRGAVRAVQAFCRDWQPEALVGVGDEADSSEVSRWSRGMPDEYQGDLQRGFDVAHEVLRGFREAAPDAAFHISRSNHGDRLRNYIEKHGPALRTLRTLDYGEQLGFRELGIVYHPRPFFIAPRLMVAHGDEGSMIKSPGGTALNIAKRFGYSVMCGHTHRFGVQHHTEAVNGEVTRKLWGYEVGHLMSMKRALYLKAGYGDWSQGFAVVRQIEGRAYVEMVPIHDRSFAVEGQEYLW
jgi:hypothetical protein